MADRGTDDIEEEVEVVQGGIGGFAVRVVAEGMEFLVSVTADGDDKT